ncbi:putative Initiation factor 2 subunit family [Trypanosoma vivax]|nr:putative translation initiation factor eIF2B subunit-like protein [Trypanosoma vivax]KAH8619015.1 putative Initiation factor 2 subunit family [Trypanosoma vivax]
MSAVPTNVPSLAGQGSEEAKAAVRVQRDMKRKKDSLRKLKMRIKSLKPEDTSYNPLMEEMEKIKEEISVLEKMLPPTVPGIKESAVTPRLKQGGPATPRTGGNGKKVAHKSASLSPSRSLGKQSPRGHHAAPKHHDAAGNSKQVSPPVSDDPSARCVPFDSDNKVDIAAQLRERIESSVTTSVYVAPVSQPLVDSRMIHYQVAELAMMMESMMIVGGNARTFAMLDAFRALLKSTPILSPPALNDVNPQSFENLIKMNFEFLCRSRDPSAGMTHAKDALIRRVVTLLSQGQKMRASAVDFFGLPTSSRSHEQAPDSELPSLHGSDVDSSFSIGPRDLSLKVLDSIERELQLSIKSIIEDRSAQHLSSNDTILVFGRSSTVELILLAAAGNPRLVVKPKVIVVDSAPLYEGRALATRLSCSGLTVTYGLITTCCTLMPRCTRVFIGAAAVLQNGDVFSRCGTAVVVASAKQYRKPVLCFSESMKFVPEVWLGNLGQNTKLTGVRHPHHGELRLCSPRSWSTSPLHGREVLEESRVLGNGNSATGRSVADEHSRLLYAGSRSSSGYLYDLTPAAYIDMIICEMGCLHTSAIVAALRDREDRDDYLMSSA